MAAENVFATPETFRDYVAEVQARLAARREEERRARIVLPDADAEQRPRFDHPQAGLDELLPEADAAIVRVGLEQPRPHHRSADERDDDGGQHRRAGTAA